ncbi:MAG: hypothetical protein JWO38_2045 [Gemmataceae bacterium]|nr:hypothetical protein [Gemmataceae bacterium]
MTAPVRYFAFRAEAGGPVTGLWRIQDDGQAVWGEVLAAGEWSENQAVLGCLYDPGMAAEVTPAEAAVLASRLSGTT